LEIIRNIGWNILIHTKNKVNLLLSLYRRILIHYKESTIILVISLIVILEYLVFFYPPIIDFNRIIYIIWIDKVYSGQHIFIVPAVYISILFLAFSIQHLRSYVKESFINVRDTLEKNESNNLVESLLNKVLSYKSKVFAFFSTALLWSIELRLHLFNKVEVLYINKPILVYFVLLLSILGYFAARFVWLLFTSIYAIYKFSRIPFEKDINKISNWIRSDKLGGIKSLSNLSLRFILIYIIGVLIFSPAPMWYGYYLYVFSFFGILVVGTSLFFITQFFLYLTIKREKSKLMDIIEEKYSGKDRDVYISIIEQIKSWPVDIKIISGLFFSTIMWPFIIWYLSKLLADFIKYPKF